MLNILDIQEILPHRYPFLMIDKIIELEPIKRAVAVKNVTYNEPFFQGHFPSEPVMPGVLIVEALAQTGACSVLSHDDYKGKTAYFMGIDKVRFRRKVVPGDMLVLEADIDHFKNGRGHGKCVAKVGEEIACQVEITFVVR